MDGVGFHHDTPRFGPITLAANGTFSRQSGYGGQRTVYFGAGPGVRFNFEQMTFFGHFLLGGEVGVGTRMGREATAAAFKPRGGLGMSYRLTRNVRLRGGLDFDTHPHVLAGVGLRF